jgi:hypothetical protein
MTKIGSKEHLRTMLKYVRDMFMKDEPLDWKDIYEINLTLGLENETTDNEF